MGRQEEQLAMALTQGVEGFAQGYGNRRIIEQEKEYLARQEERQAEWREEDQALQRMYMVALLKQAGFTDAQIQQYVPGAEMQQQVHPPSRWGQMGPPSMGAETPAPQGSWAERLAARPQPAPPPISQREWEQSDPWNQYYPNPPTVQQQRRY